MNRILSIALAAGAALGIGATAAQAQVAFGVGGGLTLPTGDFKTFFKTGWHALANVGYDLPSGIGVRGDFYYGQNNTKSGVTPSGKIKLGGGLGNVLYSFSGGGTVHPYILGSVGFFNVKADAGSAGSASESKVAFGGGGGIKFRAGSDANFFVEGRYITVNTSGSNTNFIPITAGVSFGLK